RGRGLAAFGYPGPHAFDPVVGGLEDFQSIQADLQADAAVGDLLQRLGDQAVERLRPIAGQLPAEGSVDLPQRGGAVDDQGAVVLGMDIGAAQGVLVAELADDFFEDVFQCDDAEHVAIFVDDDADASLLFLEVQQLGRKRSVLGDEVGLVTGLEQAFLGQLVVAEQPGDLSHVDDAFDLIDVLVEYRQPSMRCGAQLADDDFQVVLEVDAGDFVARDHDVIYGHSFKVENAEQHALAIHRQVAARLAHHAAQLFGGQAVGAFLRRIHADQPEHAVADPAEHRHQRVQHLL